LGGTHEYGPLIFTPVGPDSVELRADAALTMGVAHSCAVGGEVGIAAM